MTSGLEMEQACSYIRGAPQAIPSELKDNNFSRMNFKADFEAWILVCLLTAHVCDSFEEVLYILIDCLIE